jgi:hypothetical protein
LKRENAQLLQLVGEITLKLSEAQKKKWGKRGKHLKLSGPESWVFPEERCIIS